MVYYGERLHVEGAVLAGNLIEQGAIGKVIEIKTRMGHTGPLGPGAKHKIAETSEPMTEAEKCSTWWHQHDCGGGAMADYCCYGSVVSYWMAGKPAVAAMGMRVNSIHALADAEDNAAMIVRYPDCYAVLEGTPSSLRSSTAPRALWSATTRPARCSSTTPTEP